jgi:hypothetical protein
MCYTIKNYAMEMIQSCAQFPNKASFKYINLKCSIFWNISPCSPQKLNRRLGGTCRLHLQARKRRQARNQRESSSKQIPPKHRLTSKRTTGCYIPDDRTLHNHRCKNLKSCTVAMSIRTHFLVNLHSTQNTTFLSSMVHQLSEPNPKLNRDPKFRAAAILFYVL